VSDPDAGTTKHTVVIADDTPDMRRLLAMTLQRAGDFHVVAEAGDGVEAIEAVTLHQPDLVLLDITMPNMDGLEALPAICEACPSTTVVMLSGVSGRKVVELALAAGAAGFAHKGRPLQELVSQARVLLGTGTAQPEIAS
jgi:DNA-binding NarL/FixJ family response regulator